MFGIWEMTALSKLPMHKVMKKWLLFKNRAGMSSSLLRSMAWSMIKKLKLSMLWNRLKVPLPHFSPFQILASMSKKPIEMALFQPPFFLNIVTRFSISKGNWLQGPISPSVMFAFKPLPEKSCDWGKKTK